MNLNQSFQLLQAQDLDLDGRGFVQSSGGNLDSLLNGKSR